MMSQSMMAVWRVASETENEGESDPGCAPTRIWEIFGPSKFPKFPVVFSPIDFSDGRRPVALILDTETTGLSPSADRIVELAMVDENGTVVYQSLFNPGMPIPPRATEIHHITNAMVASAPRFVDEIPKIRRLIADHGNHLVAFNASFDLGFLKGAVPEDATVECAMAMASAALRLTSGRISLEKASHYAGHEWTGDAHRALADALATLTVWRWAKRKIGDYGPEKSPKTQNVLNLTGGGSGRLPAGDNPRENVLSSVTATDEKIPPEEIALSAETARKVERLASILASITQFQAEEKALKEDLRLVADGRAVVSTVGNLVLSVRSPIHHPASVTYSVDEPAFAALPPETRQRLLDAGAVRAAYVIDGDGYEALKQATKQALEKRGVVAVDRKAERTVAAAVSVRKSG